MSRPTDLDTRVPAPAPAAIAAILAAERSGSPALVVPAPPGAGKTSLVLRLATDARARHGRRCMIATQTNEQAFDIARRLPAVGGEDVLFASERVAIPDDIRARANLRVVHAERELPAGPCVVIGNVSKWSFMDATDAPFDLLVVDEAWQLPDFRFAPIVGLARRFVLVGDPGQIDPVITTATERWNGDPAGPHVAAPAALLARHPTVPVAILSISRRLVPDTVALVQPVFYPQLHFTAGSTTGARGLRAAPVGTSHPADAAIGRVAGGASLVQVELPAQASIPDPDPEVAAALVALASRLLARRAQVYDEAGEHPLTAGMIGIVCAQVAQVGAVRARLPRALDAIMVETADRWQGLERPVMLVHHPFAGRREIGPFHLDRGRFCVMLSRHRVACIIVTRAGMRERLERYALEAKRVLGLAEDVEYAGWRAHMEVQKWLATRGHITPYGASAPHRVSMR